jgi:hypothetical protein
VPCLRQIHYLLLTPARSVTSLREDRKWCIPGMVVHSFSKSDFMSHVVLIVSLDVAGRVSHVSDRTDMVSRVEIICAAY